MLAFNQNKERIGKILNICIVIIFPLCNKCLRRSKSHFDCQSGIWTCERVKTIITYLIIAPGDFALRLDSNVIVGMGIPQVIYSKKPTGSFLGLVYTTIKTIYLVS